jgi:transposase, IS5 family
VAWVLAFWVGCRDDGLKPLVREGIEATVLRTFNDRPATLWETVLPLECQRLPAELEAVDALLDDVRFFAPYRAIFDPVLGRPSIAIETYVRMMFVKFRYRLGFETLCREVSDLLSWRRFCRIGLGEAVPRPTTLMKITKRCGPDTIDALNATLLAKAAEVCVRGLYALRLHLPSSSRAGCCSSNTTPWPSPTLIVSLEAPTRRDCDSVVIGKLDLLRFRCISLFTDVFNPASNSSRERPLPRAGGRISSGRLVELGSRRGRTVNQPGIPKGLRGFTPAGHLPVRCL